MKKLLLLSVLFLFINFIPAQLPCNVLVGYYQSSWGPYVPLSSVNNNYNVFCISFLEAGGSDGISDNNSVYNLNFYATNDGKLRQDIPVVQAQGKKVLMSIGGGTGSFKLNSPAEVTFLVNKVKTVIQTYGLDGIDVDLERPTYLSQNMGGTVSTPEAHITYVIDAVQQLLTWYKNAYGKKMILTLVPEVAYTTGGLSPYMSAVYGAAYLPIIETLKNDIDLLMIQLYNASGGNYALDGMVYNHGTPDFIISQTEAIIKGFACTNGKGVFSGISPSQIAVCLPASAGSADGYIGTAAVKMAMDYLRGTGPKPGMYTLKKAGGYPEIHGMATWSINNDLTTGYSYAANYATIFSSCLTTNITENEKSNTPLIYPNPANTQITIENISGVPLKIFNAVGQLVLEKTITNEKNSIDISHLTPGLYLIQTGNAVQKLMVD